MYADNTDQGIDSLADNEITSAATHYETGGVGKIDVPEARGQGFANSI